MHTIMIQIQFSQERIQIVIIISGGGGTMLLANQHSLWRPGRRRPGRLEAGAEGIDGFLLSNLFGDVDKVLLVHLLHHPFAADTANTALARLHLPTLAEERGIEGPAMQLLPLVALRIGRLVGRARRQRQRDVVLFRRLIFWRYY